MNKLLIPLLLLITPYSSFCQEKSDLELEAYFSAIIVSDIDTSIRWYSSVLGFEVLNKVESEERGFKQSNLKRGEILLELIELDHAVSPSEVIPNYDSKTRLNGFFKVGFRVSNFEKWMDHLINTKVNFYGNVVNDPNTDKKMIIITDPDSNRIQIFEK